MKQYLHAQVPNDRVPRLLEIGIDRGVTLIPLSVFLARTRTKFEVIGVDVKVQDQVRIVAANLDLQPGQEVHLIEENSLNVLPRMVDQGMKFDAVMIDGDHNYHTVAEELKHLEGITHPWSLVVIDDYDGRWSERDLWYSERPEYGDVTIATAPVATDKHGVKPAVDEWLAAHPDWQLAKPVPGEPVILMKRVV